MDIEYISTDSLPNRSDSTPLTHLTDLVMRSRALCKSDGIEGAVSFGLQFKNGFTCGFTAGLRDDEHIPDQIKSHLISFSLALDVTAFAVVFEGWGVSETGVSPEMAEGMAAMRRRGALPRPSQDPRRVEVLMGARGDLETTQEGIAVLNAAGAGDVQWKTVPMEKLQLVTFTLVAFDSVTVKEGATRIGLTPEILRAMARARLLRTVGERGFTEMLALSERPKKEAKPS